MVHFNAASILSAAILLAAAGMSAGPAHSRWIHLQTGHFDLYSSLTQDRSAALLGRLEDARQALSHVTVYASTDSLPVRVIAFRSEEEFRPYQFDPDSTAYYLHSPYRDYIVVGGNAPNIYIPAAHEYAHYVIHRQFRSLPRWLDEGLADVYSTVEQRDGVVRVGRPLEDRLEWLRRDGLAYDLPFIFQVRQNTFTNARSTTPQSRFYAQSWLLVHMLRMDPHYSPQFNDFLREIDGGKLPEQALQGAFHKSAAEVTADLSRYLKSEKMPTAVMRINEPAAATKASMPPMQTGVPEAILGDLLSALSRFPEARELLSQGIAANAGASGGLSAGPNAGNIRLEESLSYYFLRQRQPEQALPHLLQAVNLGSSDPRIFYDAARLELSRGAPASKAVRLLKHALVLRPGYEDARKQLDSLAAGATGGPEPASGILAQPTTVLN